MSERTLTLSWPQRDIAVLTFDTPGKGANVLSTHVFDELNAFLDELQTRRDVAGLIFQSAKPGIFVAGADLREFLGALNAPKDQIAMMCHRGQTTFRRLSQCPFVTVAAINGVCVGGGAELAIWCDRRLMSDNPRSEFGFPEVKLGLFPGWGGTVRAPRVVGLANAVELVTGGESISSSVALAMGLASAVAHADRVLDTAIELVRVEQETQQYLRDRVTWSGPIGISETELGFLGATASAVIGAQTKGKYPAPQAALALMMEAASEDETSALTREAEGMAELFGSPVNQALLNVFFLTDRNKKDRGIEDENIRPATIQRVGVVGAGIMGSGISGANLRREISVVLSDAAPESLRRGAQTALEEAAYDRAAKGPTRERLAQLAPYLSTTSGSEEFARCDLVIEAIVERPAAKVSLYEVIEPLLPEHAVLATNTSTIPVTQLAAGLKHPDRFCGIHFFNPVSRMKLVEVIRGQKTSDETVATAVAYAKRLGKSPVVVKDGPGFLVNRLLMPYMNEAVFLLAEGVSIDAIEKAATGFGMPMGPITLFDMVGLDTAVHAGETLENAFPDRVLSSPVLQTLVDAGRLGRKSGKGFFAYPKRNGKPSPDPELAAVLKDVVAPPAPAPDREQLTNRLFMPMLLEATRLLEDGLVRDPRDVDLALIFGIGFPPFRGGLLFWADQLGASKILQQVEPLEKLGGRFHATDLLRHLARSGGTLYGNASQD